MTRPLMVARASCAQATRAVTARNATNTVSVTCFTETPLVTATPIRRDLEANISLRDGATQSPNRRSVPRLFYELNRLHEPAILHRNVRFHVRELNRESPVRTRQSPTEWNLHAVGVPIIGIIDLRRIPS